ncbi:MAG: DUF4468 domain-containing protein, partial [Muricauda sp.]|nr:DUF4468 domain-containing protein [Allomuricauda sp.]
MKKILFLICLLPIVSFSQVTIDSLNARIYLKQVHEVGLNQKELKSKAYEWVARSFNNSNYVTRINNESQILAKGAFDVGADFTNYGVTVYSPRKVDYTLDLQFKQGRYKIEIVDVTITAGGMEEPFVFYLADFETYKGLQRKLIAELDMPGTKATLRRLENESKARKDYESLRAYYDEILPQIIETLESIDTSLLKY